MSDERSGDDGLVPAEFDEFELIILKRPKARPEMSDEDAARLQTRHLQHLRAMHDAGHLAVAGPFDDQDDEALRGLGLYHTGSVERSRALAEADPAVVAGVLEVEAMRFYCEKGFVRVPGER